MPSTHEPVVAAAFAESELDRLEFPPGPIPGDRQFYFAVKSAMDRVTAVVLLVAFSPILLICMALIRLTSRGPAIFSQRRTGAGGKTFVMYKLRSMVQDAERVSGKQWSKPGDPRVTRVGRFLRFTHLDEIPQLFNVVRGEMSLIGPRPERPEFVATLVPLIDEYYRRHAIKPGITGLAQIYLPPDTDIASVERKIKYDLMYLKHANWLMDLRIFACTLLRIFAIRGGIGPSWTGLSRSIERIRYETELEKQRLQTRDETRRKRKRTGGDWDATEDSWRELSSGSLRAMGSSDSGIRLAAPRPK